MVNTRASSRESTPGASIHGPTYTERLRTSARRSATTPVDGGTPSGKSRAKKGGPTAAARTGNTSHAYGVSTQALSSRVAGRSNQGFSSALNDELVEQEPELTSVLSPVVEENQHSSVVSTPAGNASLSFSTSLTDQSKDEALNGKSFSHKREEGLSHRVHAPAFPDPVIPDLAEPQGPTIYERTGAAFFDLVSGGKVFLNDYWKLLLGILLALTFGSLLAVYGVPAIGSIFPGNSLSDPVYIPGEGHHFTTTVISYLPKQSDRAAASRIDRLESRVHFLEDEIARSRAANTLLQAPFNHISASIGAVILPLVSSMTKSTTSPWLKPLAKLYSAPAMKGPLTALQPWSEPGECWCTPADKAALGVRAPYPVQASAVTIEHVLAEDLAGSGADLGTAPSLVEVWARVAVGPDARGECLGAAPDNGKGWSCLGRLKIAHHVRDVKSWTMDLARADVVAQDFVFNVLENVGNADATCLYRVQLHGAKF